MKKDRPFKYNATEEMEAIEARLLLVRKQTGLEIIADIAIQSGKYSHINNVDLKLELIKNALGIVYKKD